MMRQTYHSAGTSATSGPTVGDVQRPCNARATPVHRRATRVRGQRATPYIEGVVRTGSTGCPLHVPLHARWASGSCLHREAIAWPGWPALRPWLVPDRAGLEQTAHGGFEVFAGQAQLPCLILLNEEGRRIALAGPIADAAVLPGEAPQEGKEHVIGPGLLREAIERRRASDRQEQAVLVAQGDALRDRPVV